jgi:molybdopterin-guanine dinucleotide biosynthesis protein A
VADGSVLSGYVLAGGQSSRMGRDKAELELGGKTLLARAVETLGSVCDRVTVVGDREVAGVRQIRDLHAGCGPLGGIEAGLRDLIDSGGGDWAVFLPVDMPFVPSGLLKVVMRGWLDEVDARICYVTVDRRPQPLVSMVHREVLPAVQEALERGDFKVVRVLGTAAEQLAVAKGAASGALLRTVEVGDFERFGWEPTAVQWEARHLWFANLNTPEELLGAEVFAGALEP